MRRISNPYQNLRDYNCFGCSPENSLGLRMKFYEDGEHVVSHWFPNNNFQGYINILHGGIQATLMDEIASWFVQVKLKTAGVTAKLETKFLKPVLIDKGEVLLKASLIEERNRLALIAVELFDGAGSLCSVSKVSYFVYTKEIARKNFNYPDFKEFFKE